ncbi:glutamine synthetase family protein [Crocosphaera sp. XPORK-15E]|uniref:glutamine synthetase family protein n=1 Tax=Crocosphaera sp. XPORK-15E TaxID=3110247 RepID=UPI002B1EB70F|nr:glutamine synthetase family protein [Crocosphaera sp. XPORK-15E]MEA5536239.1 glutamine synthetase family protein [Crocosphaera sp. XPORK-15E]
MDNEILKALDQAEVRFVRILWCDNANVIRAKAIHNKRLSAHFTHGVGITAAQQALPVMYDVPAAGSGLGPVGEVCLVPDWDTLTLLPYAKTHARVMGDMVVNGKPWACCPRHFLKRAIAAAEVEGLEIRAAFENEFYLVQASAEGIVPTDDTVFASTLSMDLQQAVIDDIADALLAQGVTVELYHPESGWGQQEISVLYSNALRAADQQIIFRETVKAIARFHDLKASFLPKIWPNQAGSGCHIHLSLWQDGKNLLPHVKGNGQLAPIAEHFIAGMLHHLPALMALTTPIPNSYRRLQPSCWSGAFRCWGFDNREAAIRVPTNPEPPSPTHLELKTVDASANPYLALGAVMAAGLDGIRRRLDLVHPVALDPCTLKESERQNQGIERLPTNLGDSLEHLKQDELLLTALGPDLAKSFLAVRQAEWEAMKDWDLDAEVKLLLERY